MSNSLASSDKLGWLTSPRMDIEVSVELDDLFISRGSTSREALSTRKSLPLPLISSSAESHPDETKRIDNQMTIRGGTVGEESTAILRWWLAIARSSLRGMRGAEEHAEKYEEWASFVGKGPSGSPEMWDYEDCAVLDDGYDEAEFDEEYGSNSALHSCDYAEEVDSHSDDLSSEWKYEDEEWHPSGAAWEEKHSGDNDHEEGWTMAANFGTWVYVTVPYESCSSIEISLGEGEWIWLELEDDTGWWYGANEHLTYGWFPATCVTFPETGAEYSSPTYWYATALYDVSSRKYQTMENEAMLDFSQGQDLIVWDWDDDLEWYFGALLDDESSQGWFPAASVSVHWNDWNDEEEEEVIIEDL